MTGAGAATRAGRSPVHAPGRTARWTTSNVDEGLPGTLTPLTWSFYFPAAEAAARGAWCSLGAESERERPVPDDVDGRFFTSVFGHAAANIDRFGAMADRMPGGSRAAMEEQLFGSTAPPDAGSTRGRYPIVALKAPFALRRSMRALKPLARETESWWRTSVAAGSPLSEDAAVAALEDARARFGEVLNVHMILSMVCQGVLERVAAVAVAAGEPGLENELVLSDEGTAEFELVADLRALANGELGLDAFLGRHGYHGPQEGLLDATVWREDPAPVVALKEAYAERELAESTEELVERRRAEHAAAVTRLERGLGRARSVPARRLVRFASHAPVWRETGRATILRAVDGGRFAARSAGVALARRGALADPEDVFFLSADELVAGAGGDLRELAAARRDDHERFATMTLPHIWRGEPEVEIEAERGPDAAPAPAPKRLEGLGVSSGVGEGVARVVVDQRDAEVAEGDVMVCRATDPSWASLFPLATAVVTDVGSAMSHAAIVCRELGIPCVANTREGTSLLRDGLRVRVDGDAGTVDIIGGREETR